MPFKLRWINAKWRQIALNYNALCLVYLSDAPNTDSVHSKKFSISSKIKTFVLIIFFLNIKHVYLIQIKCVDFNSTQFNAFGVEFKAFNAIQCVFKLRWILQFDAFLNCVELTPKGIKLHWIKLSSIQCIYTPHKNF